ncbi:hypothetical protein ITJ64_18070 [Herbiconiux sp. VKM Ac-1786]|uniref:DUF5719 family protein n=1 Tax=Herbiconiux sp. VKM Ac-1786 TaxID=2783824 RepID=UPI00188B92B9|nr:DUF5719 family protein [Herbiconiux sp. VKM Ac-1786]MBF4574421.1 hypothetical protein [Herbiconiux sp. VKM Ac-1786]
MADESRPTNGEPENIDATAASGEPANATPPAAPAEAGATETTESTASTGASDMTGKADTPATPTDAAATTTAETTTTTAETTTADSAAAKRAARPRRTRRPAKPAKRPATGSRRAVATGARIATGVVVVALGAAVVGAAFALPLPAITAAPSAETVDPAPAEEVRACPGPLVRLSDESGQDATAISGVGTAQTDEAATTPDAAIDVSALLSPDDRTSTADSAPLRIALPADAAAAGDTLFAAAQSQNVAEGDLVGLATAACGEASADSWLVAGATTVGRTSFVVLGNPGDVPAVVDLALYGEQGAIDAPGASNIDVPARSTRILSLAGLAPDLASPVLHVTAEVGAVTAALQQSVVRGLAPGGAEVAGSIAGASTEQVIAGIRVSGTSSIAEQVGSPETADLQSVLRMVVPGADPASVTIRVAEERTGGTETEYQVGLTPGVVTEFPLQDIPDGLYSVTIDSDQPVVAGARTSTIVNGKTDFAWYQPVEQLDSPFFVTIADGPGARLHLVNETEGDADVVFAKTDGTESTGTFVPGARSLSLEPGSYLVTSSVPVGATVSYFGDGVLSSYAIARPGPEATPITVYP